MGKEGGLECETEFEVAMGDIDRHLVGNADIGRVKC